MLVRVSRDMISFLKFKFIDKMDNEISPYKVFPYKQPQLSWMIKIKTMSIENKTKKQHSLGEEKRDTTPS